MLDNGVVRRIRAKLVYIYQQWVRWCWWVADWAYESSLPVWLKEWLIPVEYHAMRVVRANLGSISRLSEQDMRRRKWRMRQRERQYWTDKLEALK